MALRVKLEPKLDFLYSFLKARGFILVDEKPNILHYCGTDIKELLRLVKEDSPDFVVIHHLFDLKKLRGIFWAYYSVRSEAEFHKIRKIYTNSYALAQKYFQLLGKQAEIIVLSTPQQKREVDFAFKVKSWFMWFSQLMEWE